MNVIGYFAAILIGISLGMIGSGGSILTVPVLVYLMNIHPLLATTSSLFIVGTTSLAGGIRAYVKKQVDFKSVTEFGIPSIFSIFLTRHFLLPVIPQYLFSIGNVKVSRDMFLMLVFAAMMIIVSVTILQSKENRRAIPPDKEQIGKAIQLALYGLIIGVITGLLGAGGGFIIIPFLVFICRLPMKTAVGTSLLIIAINSLFGFLFSLKQFDYNWTILVSFTILAIGGIFIGSWFADKIPGALLKKGFGWFVLIMAVYIILKETFLL
jgi:uncharacterized membrane protein YfcA